MRSKWWRLVRLENIFMDDNIGNILGLSAVATNKSGDWMMVGQL